MTYSGLRNKHFREHLALASRDVIDFIENYGAMYENAFNEAYNDMYSRSIDRHFHTWWERLYVEHRCTMDMEVFKNACEVAFSVSYNMICDDYLFPEDWTCWRRIMYTYVVL